ncbi:hypothetical protein BD310DRAFT_825738, partial [Dichomitus squalens]
TFSTAHQSRYANAEPLLNPPHRCLIFHIDTLPLFQHALVEHSGIGLVVLPTLEVGDGVKLMRVTRVPVDLGTPRCERSERQRCGGQCMRTCQGMQREVLREGLYADVHEEVNENLRSIDDERGERQERGKPLNEPGPQNCTTESLSTAESRVSTVQTAKRVRSPVTTRPVTRVTPDGWNANRTSVGFWASVRLSNSSTISGLSRPRDLRTRRAE